MKSLIIFYSLDGNTKYIANLINDELNSDIIELKPKKEMSSKGFLKYFWGGKQVMLGEKPELDDIKVNFTKYDLIIFGTPIWAGNYAPVYNTFFEKYCIENKKIVLFCCHGGGKEGKAFTKFKEKLKGNNYLGEISIEDPLKKGIDTSAIKEWIKDITKLE